MEIVPFFIGNSDDCHQGVGGARGFEIATGNLLLRDFEFCGFGGDGIPIAVEVRTHKIEQRAQPAGLAEQGFVGFGGKLDMCQDVFQGHVEQGADERKQADHEAVIGIAAGVTGEEFAKSRAQQGQGE
jgi:hypothetical protein